MSLSFRPIFRVLATVALGTGFAMPAASHPSLVGGFRPIASEQSARALWVNPASVGVSGMGATVTEIFFSDDALSLAGEEPADWKLPTDLQGLSTAASTDRLAYGFQKEFDDVAGVPDWTFAIGNGVPVGRKARIGATLERRGGDDAAFDATAGLLVRSGRRVWLAAVVRDIFEKRTDGEDVDREWQLGAALPVRSILGTFTYDAVMPSGDQDAVHWLGFSLDRAQQARLALFRSSEGDWSAQLDLAFTHHLLGLGARSSENTDAARPHRGYLAAEWRGVAMRGARPNRTAGR